MDLVRTYPAHFTAKKDEYNWTVDVLGLKCGHVIISANVTNVEDAE